jgi:hypothetical protein
MRKYLLLTAPVIVLAFIALGACNLPLSGECGGGDQRYAQRRYGARGGETLRYHG